MRPLTAGEARRFLDAARDHPLEALFTLTLTTGMRQGELLGLRWRDVEDDADRHPAADHERDPAEHLLFGDVLAVGEHRPDPLAEGFAVRHPPRP